MCHSIVRIVLIIIYFIFFLPFPFVPFYSPLAILAYVKTVSKLKTRFVSNVITLLTLQHVPSKERITRRIRKEMTVGKTERNCGGCRWLAGTSCRCSLLRTPPGSSPRFSSCLYSDESYIASGAGSQYSLLTKGSCVDAPDKKSYS